MISHDRWAVLELDRDVRDMLAGLDTVLPEPFHRLGVAGARRAVAALRPSTGDPVPEVSEVSIPGRHGPIPARIYRPEDAAGSSIVYFHGGGWTMGGLDGADACCRRLANLTRSTVISVDYRLAPEHKFPIPVDDCFDAVTWWSEHDRASGPIALAGDSAGANLAIAVCLRARDAGGPAFAAQLLAYPVFDDPRQHASFVEYQDGPLLMAADVLFFLSNYLRDEMDLLAPEAIPSRSTTLAGLPPAIVVTASHDPLRDGAEAYIPALLGDGVPAELLRVPGTVHGFFTEVGSLGGADRAVEAVAAFARIRFAESMTYRDRTSTIL